MPPLHPPDQQQHENRKHQDELTGYQQKLKARQTNKAGHQRNYLDHPSSRNKVKSKRSGRMRLPISITTAETAAENTAAQ